MATLCARPRLERARQSLAALVRTPRLDQARHALAALRRGPTARRRGRRLELDLNGPIGKTDQSGAGILAEEVLSILNNTRDVTEIRVEIFSCGGCVADALQIFDALVDHPANVTTRANRECVSAATIILMAGDRREAYPNTQLLIHSVSIEPLDAVGSDRPRCTAPVLRALAASAESTDQRLLDIYEARSGGRRAFFEQELRNEKTMTLATAERHGIIHGLVGGASARDVENNVRLAAQWQAFRRATRGAV